MKDDQGRVKIRGFYRGIRIDKQTKSILAKTPDDLPALHRSIGIHKPESVGPNLQEALQYPSLNIDGIRAGYVGAQARTIIPDLATAAMDIRLVKETKGERMIQLLKDHIRRQGYTLLDHEPGPEERGMHDNLISLQYQVAYEAFRTEMNTPVGRFLVRALKECFGQNPISIRTHGGSIPISPFVIRLGIPAVSVPVVNYDNNQHSENENIRIGNYVDGIKTYFYVLNTPYEPGSKN
jgi:acetylornithine deacetylase/succinyl-diaminopimelate desuccinylase-like protein